VSRLPYDPQIADRLINEIIPTTKQKRNTKASPNQVGLSFDIDESINPDYAKRLIKSTFENSFKQKIDTEELC